MTLDLEHELLREAHTLCVKRQGLRDDFTADELREHIDKAPLDKTLRLGHSLLAHLIDALLDSLAAAGFLERIDARCYVLTAQASAYIEREPAYLSRDEMPIAEPASAPLRWGRRD